MNVCSGKLKPGAQGVMCWQAKRLESIFSRNLRWLRFSESGFQQSLRHGFKIWGEKGLVNPISFRDFLKHLSCLLPLNLTSFSPGRNILSPRNLLHNTGTEVPGDVWNIVVPFSCSGPSCSLGDFLPWNSVGQSLPTSGAVEQKRNRFI